ncbi:MAG TPA: aromatic ring-hydroxylating dioxygenase subunit alpha [Alphaproteobacteria bacterium]|nr:aromatic ring-hydroxylating dioxygenase subunit alpha [Alphaproteobacteria bacterium]
MSAAGDLFMDQYPELPRTPVPVEPYVSDAFYDKERTAIFKRSWVNVGREADVAEAGQYFVRNIEIAETSVLVVRGSDGVVRAFHNMCSHRGNPVAWEARGKCRYFTCQFHGWAYDTKGALVHVSDADRFFGINLAENGLTPIHCGAWQGFIFINLADAPDESLEDFLAPVTEFIDGYPFTTMVKAHGYRAVENVNWKTLIEAQMEGWHLPYLHKNTLARTATDKGKRFKHAALKAFGPHSLVSSAAPETFSPSPVAAISFRYGVGTFDAFSVENETEGKGPKWHGAFDLYHIFPNFYVGMLRGTFFTYNVWPLARDKTVWEVTVYYPPVENAGQLFAQSVGSVGLRDTLREDAFTHEQIGRVIGSGAKKYFHLQDEETAIRNFLSAVNERVDA